MPRLTSVTIPNSVTTIGDDAFWHCTGLTSITVEKGNAVYDSRENCNAIIETQTNTLIRGCKNTIIPGSVTTIGSGAFWACTGLTSVTIPNSVTTIGDIAFWGCTNLKEIYSLSETPPVIYSSTFSDYSATLYVPIGAKETYQTTDYWKEFANIVEMDFTGITEISPDATDGFGNGAIYDLYGRPVSKPAKGGIYIIGGKKVVL